MLGLLALLTLLACGPIYDTQYSYAPPPTAEGRVCAMQCQQTEAYCARSCDLEAETCRAEQRAEAAEAYERYVRDRSRAGKSIDRSLSDFDQSYMCSSSGSCRSQCSASYRGCFSACGGAVSAERVCVAFCN
ncbi:MAG: hypothetical protein HXY25_05310 [Alphaproteobacteria bacterium]|nr:hypothetical protein [Alphaproteobacteria bacterium]